MRTDFYQGREATVLLRRMRDKNASRLILPLQKITRRTIILGAGISHW
jgi:hypothetical protein